MFFILICVALAFAKVHVPAFTHESVDFHKFRGWTVDPDSSVPHNIVQRFVVFLRHAPEQEQALDDLFFRVSEPSHADYGKHVTIEELNNMMRHEERHDRVQQWLLDSGVSSDMIVSRGDALEVMAPVRVIEALFDAQLRFFAPTHQPTKRVIRAHGQLRVPAELADDIQFVSGLTEFVADNYKLDMGRGRVAQRPKRRPLTSDVGASRCPNCANVTPQLLRAYYNVSDMTVSGQYNNKQAVSSFGEGYNAQALDLFGRKIANSSHAYTISQTPGGAPSPQLDEGEGQLDVEYMVAMGGDGTAETWFWSVENTFWILEYVLDITGTKDVPLVHSLSYGTSIQQQCAIATSWCNALGYNSADYVARTNIELKKAGALGLTILVSSGDNGAIGRANNGHAPLDPQLYCPLGGCQNTRSACQGVEMSITKSGARMECVLPLGASGFGCRGIAAMLEIAPQNYSDIFYLVTNTLNKKLGISASWDLDVEHNPHLFVPSGHSCASISYTTTVDSGTFVMAGYVFDPKETHVGQTLVDEFPGSSPYVTSVGMTAINDPRQPEVVGTILNGGIVTGGGGFSIVETQPYYQQSVVRQYLSNTPSSLLPDASMYDATNRAYPDISLTGERYIVVGVNPQNGSFQAEVVSGTSASSPALGGLLTMINEGRLSRGLPSLGFLNPMLYRAYASDPSIFNDIVSNPSSKGNNNGCTHVYCSSFGYPAQPGWDAATGLGSPNFGRLYDYLTS